MPIQFNETQDGKILEAVATGKLCHEDYAQFQPRVEQMLRKHRKIRMLFHMVDFHGWNAGAAWEDLKFGLKHFTDIERVAMVGDKEWEKGLTALSHPLTAAKVRYFDETALSEARSWVQSDMDAA